MKDFTLSDFIKKLPLFMLPVLLFTTFVKDKSNPLYVLFMIGLATLSIMALVYRTKTENGKEFVAPKKYMVLMAMIGLTVFCGIYFGLSSLYL